MRNRIGLGALMLVGLLQGCGQSQEPLDFPEDQRAFFSLNKECRHAYSAGANEIQKSRTFNECNEQRARFNRSIDGWVGKITDISTDQGGDFASLTVEADIDDHEISFSTIGTALADLDQSTLITPNSHLFEVLAEMKEGDIVSFDATFLPHPDDARGIWESSLTERGSVESPDFIVKFSGIRPYGSLRETVVKQEDGTVDLDRTERTDSQTSDLPSTSPPELTELSTAEPTSTPSFDCRLARTDAEHAICENSTLARVDVYTAEMYRCLKEMPGSDPGSLQKKQRAWIAERELCSADVGCLRSAYGRIAEEYMELSQFDQCQERVTGSL